MTTVALPSVAETFHRGMDEVLRPLFSNGNPVYLMSMWVYFYRADLHYGYDKLDGQGDKFLKPFICFTSDRIGSKQELKCQDERQPTQPFGYEVRQQVFKTVYVGVPKTMQLELPPYPLPPNIRVAQMLDAERIWSQLFLVFEHQYKNFAAQGIYNPRLPAVPAQVPHTDYHLVRGELQLEVRFKLTRNNTF